MALKQIRLFFPVLLAAVVIAALALAPARAQSAHG